jgi:hypothetical protein
VIFAFLIFFMVVANGWLAAVPPCVGFAGRLFGGMDSKPLLASCLLFIFWFDMQNH